jgi:hypothetical protein
MPQMFQQALWIGGTDYDKGQEVDLLKSMTGAGLERSSAPFAFSERLFVLFLRELLRTTREGSAFRFSTDSVCYWDRRSVVSRPLDEHPSHCRDSRQKESSNGQGVVDKRESSARLPMVARRI